MDGRSRGHGSLARGMTQAVAMQTGDLVIRPATATDIPALEALIRRSARALGEGFYTAEENEAAIAHVFGVDSELVADGTYHVAERNAEIVGCGGWSRRTTLFGGDRYAARSTGLIDPETSPARIRAFFVAPEQARGGIASALLDSCIDAARGAGFRELALMATLPGVPFYRKRDFEPEAAQIFDCGGVPVPFIPMHRTL